MSLYELPIDEYGPIIQNAVEKAFAEAGELEALRHKKVLSTIEVEKLYGFSRHTLRNWRSQGNGPDFIRTGKTVRYPQESLEAYQNLTLVRMRNRW
ncbi:helix-turn-helix domain-containing protein [Desulfobaculum bizertense]|uniref:helix-turn-helix domain-containing protein n=1 Tax=Desulfobaculum bizertense TaxID=376490 RepID=UPI001F349DD4|nr:helix-turn-helix domain-containing protein [Desulfobaculum bizertense]UIJ38566.1 helix-turn-helix domain-containing protein [Desulfobaculum bizertense]